MAYHISALLATFDNIRRMQAYNRKNIPDLEEREERLREVRKYSIEHNEELWSEANRSLCKNKIRVFFPEDEDEAIKIILGELGGERLVVKSKSNVTKHLHLVERLAEAGIGVVETDIGDRIIQIAGLPPGHPTCPAANLDRYEIAEILSNHLQKPVPSDPKVITDLLRDEIAGKISQSTIGITGANAVCVKEGSIVLVHNEGNILKVATQTDKHIVITGKDKIYPDLDSAVNMIKLLTYYGTGHLTTSYIDVISGPSKTADIESVLFDGVHGPGEIVLIVLDTLKNKTVEQKELYQCIGCGNCLTVCPVYRASGSFFAQGSHLGGIGVAKASTDGLLEQLFYCTTCNLCREHCPVELSTKDAILKLRCEYVKRYSLRPAHKRILHNLDRSGRVFEEAVSPEMTRMGKAGIVYFKGCMATQKTREISDAAMELLGKLNADYTVVPEKCCGSPVLKMGLSIEGLIDFNVSQLEQAGAKTIIFTCPGCLDTFRNYYPQKYELMHITEYLLEQMVQGTVEFEDVSEKVAYHRPCHMGTDAPERILTKLFGADYLPVDRGCCGAGGGVRSECPELSDLISQQRMENLTGTGAAKILTTCPFCGDNLGCQSRQVYDLIGYLNGLIL